MSAIFLSYRRDDSSGYAGRLFDNLAKRFGRERLFMDIETLEPGMDFVAGIDRAIESCGAVIAMIGPNWAKAQDDEGRRRLDNPHDFIRLEITSALTRHVRVIPVLVHNASMPTEQELPEPLRSLCRLQACEISDNRWEFDVSRLADVLEPLIAEPDEDQIPPPSTATARAAETSVPTGSAKKSGNNQTGWLAAVAAVVLAGGGAAWWLGQPSPPEQAPTVVNEPAPPPPQTAPGMPVAETVLPSEIPAAPTVAPESAASKPPAQDEPAAGESPEPRLSAETEPVAAPEPGEPSQEELQQREIAELLSAAEADMAELRLTRPAENNAFERFQRVLELDSANLTAREGLAAITERYHGLAEDALDRGALERAQRHLDSAKIVQPDADWLIPLQREIDQRQSLASSSEPASEPSPPPDEANRKVCLAECENRHQACREGISSQTEADCLRSHEEPCEQRFESCMSDTSKLYMGAVSHESECIGVHGKCLRSAAKECAAAAQNAERSCQTQFDSCTRLCRGLE